MSKYAELLAAIDNESVAQSELAKSLPAADTTGDATIAAAGAEEGKAKVDGEAEATGKTDGNADLTKSQGTEGVGAVTEELEVIEVDDLIKSIGLLTERVDTSETELAKALTSTLGMVKSQGEMIKSLSDRIATLSNQGTGRRAVLVSTERAQPGEHLAKSMPQAAGIQPQELLAKCLDAQRAGKLTGTDVSRAESAINHGLAVDPRIMAVIS
uniref:Uncharacterized protein n=1 Tax=Pseudomonas phage Touem01 TaxID=3138548 RepID=A0AAU6W2N6_9VIRU